MANQKILEMGQITRELEILYTECLNCPLTAKQCPKAWKNHKIGMIPRAFEFSFSSRPKLMVVAKNPGHPLDEFNERKFYIGKTGKALFNSYLKWRKYFLENILMKKGMSLKYHKNRNRYLRYILGHTAPLETYAEYSQRVQNRPLIKRDYKKILKSVAMTNVFKCSTNDEQGQLRARDVKTGYHKYFVKEISLIKPRVILAFGGEVHKILHKLDEPRYLPPIVSIKHPSYFYNKQSENMKLMEIKDNVAEFL